MSGRNGRIVTFYSFKGGVGRTMALANTAFLAATNGLRVLVMDWDLEAPGVPYYFRGQFEPLDEAALAARPGILDMVTQWTEQVKQTASPGDADELSASYQRPEAFEPFVSTLVPPERLAVGGCLHAMTAGAPKGGDAGTLAYEQALANFSWPDFFSRNAGGLLIEALREWARSTYDLVLVDSRTGFADVAGICTVQLPDLVALCFVLNRQNLDGTAKVAAAIRRQRQADVELRLVPMRLSREGTSEEADAQAFARHVLRRTGLLLRDRVDYDLQKLRIRAADGVPFYETLAPFVSMDPRKDPLTLDYTTLAEELVEHPIQIAAIDPTWRDAVRRRLEPRQATIAYLAELDLAEPTRAREEIDALIASAIHFAETGRKLEEDYVDALIKATFGMIERADTNPDEPASPFAGLLALLRRLFERQPEVWRIRLANVMERIQSDGGGLGPLDDEIATYEDIDALLAGAPPTTDLSIRRARLRQRLARLQLFSGNVDDALLSIELADGLLGTLGTHELSAEEQADLTEAVVQSHVLRGDTKLQAGDGAGAAEQFLRGLTIVSSDPTGSKTHSDILLRLIRAYLIADPPSAAAPALELAKRSAGSPQALGRLSTLYEAIVAADDPADASRRLIQLLFPTHDGADEAKPISSIVRYLGSNAMARFIITAAKLVELVSDEHIRDVEGLVVAIAHFWPKGLARGTAILAQNEELRSSVEELVVVADALGLADASSRLSSFVEQLTRSRRRSTPEGNEHGNGSA